MQIWPGKPYPLGATFDGAGTNFSLFSEAAERVETGWSARTAVTNGLHRHGQLAEHAASARAAAHHGQPALLGARHARRRFPLPVVDESFYAMFNAHQEAVEFTVPEVKWGQRWAVVLDTAEEGDHISEKPLGPALKAGGRMQVEAWSLVLLKRIAPK